MKLLVYADLQATDGHEQCFTKPGLPLQLFRVNLFFSEIARIYVEQGCCGVIDLGDTLDDRSSIPVPVIDAVLKGLDLIPDSEWNFKIIGNHEQHVKNTTISSGRMFGSKFTVIESEGVIELGDLTALFCSYPDSHERLASTIKSTAYEYRDRKLAMFGHFQAVGAQMNSGEALTGIPKAALSRFKLSMLGHIHLPQTLPGNIHYVGSPFQQDFGEAEELKRVAILDTETLRIEWIPMDVFPCYHKVSFSEFAEYVDENSEDRFQVLLRSQEEAAQYFQHPLAHRAQAVYQYDLKEQAKQAENQDDWSFNAVLKRYMQKVPPSATGIDMPHAELVELGIQITQN